MKPFSPVRNHTSIQFDRGFLQIQNYKKLRNKLKVEIDEHRTLR